MLVAHLLLCCGKALIRKSGGALYWRCYRSPCHRSSGRRKKSSTEDEPALVAELRLPPMAAAATVADTGADFSDGKQQIETRCNLCYQTHPDQSPERYVSLAAPQPIHSMMCCTHACRDAKGILNNSVCPACEQRLPEAPLADSYLAQGTGLHGVRCVSILCAGVAVGHCCGSIVTFVALVCPTSQTT